MDRPGLAAALDLLEIDHARFNAQKTFVTTTPSRFEQRRFGVVHATRDGNRADPYYNRVLGYGHGRDAELVAAIAWIGETATTDHRVRIDVGRPAGSRSVGPTLGTMGFDRVEGLVWMEAGSRSRAARQPEHHRGRVRPLATADRASIRALRETEWPIDDAAWDERSPYLCTDTFRWFGVFDEGTLVSAASMWMTSEAAVFGSAFTKASERGRGHHRALLTARLLACTAPAYVDVAPGSSSHRNCRRAGFVELERREVWVRTP